MVVLGCMKLAGWPANAAEKGLVEIVVDGCKTEIDTYCKGVKSGEGRSWLI